MPLAPTLGPWNLGLKHSDVESIGAGITKEAEYSGLELRARENSSGAILLEREEQK